MYALQSCSRNDSQSRGGPAEDRGEEGVCVKDERDCACERECVCVCVRVVVC